MNLQLNKMILSEADRCVKCGLCLPHCPTYRQLADEAESPRGRIALLQALATQQLVSSPTLRQHLNHCLQCRACEQACPSGVAYGKLLDAYHYQHEQTITSWQRFGEQRLVDLLTKPSSLRLLARPMQFGHWLLQAQPWLFRLADRFLAQLRPELLQSPVTPWPSWQPVYASQLAHQQPKQVMLFTGCLNQVYGKTILTAAIQVLTRLGYEVHIPKQQQCCGAMHFHRGDHKKARQLAQTNQAAFLADQSIPIAVTASGCAAQLIHYPTLAQESTTQHSLQAFADRVMDISQLLISQPWPEQLKLQPLKATVAVHDPCSLRNMLKQAAAPYQLLQQIPELNLSALPENEFCCGASGLYLLKQAKLSRSLQQQKLAVLAQLQPDILVTSNIGCALQLRGGIKRLALPIEVLHPVELIARQLPAISQNEKTSV